MSLNSGDWQEYWDWTITCFRPSNRNNKLKKSSIQLQSWVIKNRNFKSCIAFLKNLHRNCVWRKLMFWDVVRDPDDGLVPGCLESFLTMLSSSWSMNVSEQVELQLHCGNPLIAVLLWKIDSMVHQQINVA